MTFEDPDIDEELTTETIAIIEEVDQNAGAVVSLVVNRFNYGERGIVDRRRSGER
jgi:hypothetical protein